RARSRSSSSRLSGRSSTSAIWVRSNGSPPRFGSGSARVPPPRAARAVQRAVRRGRRGTEYSRRPGNGSGDAVAGELGCGEPPDLATVAVDLPYLERARVQAVEPARGDEQAGLDRADEPVVVLHGALERAPELPDVAGDGAEPLVQGAAELEQPAGVLGDRGGGPHARRRAQEGEQRRRTGRGDALAEGVLEERR